MRKIYLILIILISFSYSDPGDLNEDGIIDILDIVLLTNMILDDEYNVLGDINEDGVINILDIVQIIGLIFFDSLEENWIIDIDGNIYQTIQIGSGWSGQVWMAENLKTTRYRNGAPISNYPIYPNYYNGYADEAPNIDTYGMLYNWNAIMNENGICPEGFHVPDEYEWQALEIYLGMSYYDAGNFGPNIQRGTNEGSKLAGSSSLWDEGDLINDSEFNLSGFNAIPAGLCNVVSPYPPFVSMSNSSYFWTSTSSSNFTSYPSAFYREINYFSTDIKKNCLHVDMGASIRCVSD